MSEEKRKRVLLGVAMIAALPGFLWFATWGLLTCHREITVPGLSPAEIATWFVGALLSVAAGVAGAGLFGLGVVLAAEEPDA